MLAVRKYLSHWNDGDFALRTSRERSALQATLVQVGAAFLFKLGELWARLVFACFWEAGRQLE
eukprot:6338635-Pyramimonas_sp.AAC.1